MNLTTTIPQRSIASFGQSASQLGLPSYGPRLQDGAQAAGYQPQGLPGLQGQAQQTYSGGRPLLDALERVLRAPHENFAMALHLSQLKNPAPRPYHTRIALALVQDAAARLGGQVFTMGNGDLVLLCGGAGSADTAAHAPAFTLPEALQSLFGADAPRANLTTLWHLQRQEAAFRSYVTQCEAEPASRDRARDEPAASAGLAALESALRAADPHTLLVQQTAVQLRPGRGQPLSARLAPLFREIIALPHMLHTEGETPLLDDPSIERHLTTILQGRVLPVLAEDLRKQGKLTRAARLGGIRLHVNLAPAAIVSPDFARLAQMAQSCCLGLAVEITATDAAADPALMDFAGATLAHAGIPLVLDGIVHDALPMIDAAALAPAWVKLAWSPRMADAPPAQLLRIDAAIAAIGPGRIVLLNADGEAAMLWGQSRGITAYQGPYLDAVQAASRIAICHTARACTLRQCTNRALGVSAARRAGCGNPALLDMNGMAAPA